MTPELILTLCGLACLALVCLIPVLREIDREIDAQIAYRESL